MKKKVLSMQMLLASLGKSFSHKGKFKFPFVYLMFVFSVIFFNSCKLYTQVFWGVKSPRAENDKTILAFLEKKNIKSDDVLIFENFIDYANTINENKKLPFIKIYSKNGNLVAKSVSQGCDAGVKNFIEKYSMANSEQRQAMLAFSSENLKTDLQGLRSLRKKNIEIDSVNNDLQLVYYYANFMGKLSKKHFKYFQKQIDKSNLKINVLLINCDIRQNWNDSLSLNLKPAK
ncbi:MAG: hypothetical protein ACK40K_04645 [Raineya sp.]